MKVICIDASKPETPERISPEQFIVESEIYTVVNEYTIVRTLFYGLQEKGHSGLTCLYRADRFIPLSDIDELERYHLQTIPSKK